MAVRNFRELREKMAPERRARNEAQTERMLQEMPLDELRAARELTQEHLAQIFKVSQGSISRLSGARICTSARSASSSKRWAGNWRSAPCSRPEACASRSSKTRPKPPPDRCRLRFHDGLLRGLIVVIVLHADGDGVFAGMGVEGQNVVQLRRIGELGDGRGHGPIAAIEGILGLAD